MVDGFASPLWEFFNVFQKYWLDNDKGRKWIKAFVIMGKSSTFGARTNNHLESFHKTLKVYLFGDRKIRRVDEFIQELLSRTFELYHIKFKEANIHPNVALLSA